MSPRAFDESDDFDGPDTRGPARRGSSSPRPGADQYRSPQVEAILKRVADIIDGSPGMPMSASVRVNKDEVLELLDEAISRLPEELREARWLLKEREEFIARSRSDGEQLIAEAKSRVAHMVQRTEVVKAAELKAAQIIEEAQATSRRMRRETEDFCDQKLASFENVLTRVHKTVEAGRRRLAAPSLEESELAEREAPSDQGPDTGAVPVFDQDR